MTLKEFFSIDSKLVSVVSVELFETARYIVWVGTKIFVKKHCLLTFFESLNSVSVTS